MATGVTVAAILGAALAWPLVFDVTAPLLSDRAASSAVRAAPLWDRLRPVPAFDSAPPPASDAAARVMDVLTDVEARMRTTRYQHRTRVREARGEYAWDCSGMAAWVLRRAAPESRRSLGHGRPVARRFHRVIARAPTDRARRGWRRLAHVREARPGDLFAWERPPDFPSRNTGHVGFVVNAPARLADDRWAVRILDSTSLPHQDDTREPDGAGGAGRGTMVFLTDGRGRAVAYAWRGTRSLVHVHAPIAFGRVHR